MTTFDNEIVASLLFAKYSHCHPFVELNAPSLHSDSHFQIYLEPIFPLPLLFPFTPPIIDCVFWTMILFNSLLREPYFGHIYLAPGGGCEVLFSPGLSVCLSVCLCVCVSVCPANILVFYFSAIRRDIDLKFIQDTYRVVLNSLK